MNDFIAIFKSLDPLFDKIQESPLSYHGQVVGYETTVLNNQGRAIAGGIGFDQQSSRQKAVSEFIERKLFKNLLDQKNQDLKIIDFPTTCGFAVGFHKENTKQRSINEALERWAWSQWIDYQCKLEKSDMHLTPLADFLQSHFESVYSFKHEFRVNNQTLYFTVTLGKVGNGVFAGSKVSDHLADSWEHSLSESFRHFLIFTKKFEKKNLFQNRIHFFGENGHLALEQIEKSTNLNWPQFEIDFCREVETSIVGVFAYRTLMKNYIGWHHGTEKRFIY